MTALLYVFEIIFVFICIFLVLLILIQKGRGGGLASAFGGAGGQTAFGTKTGDVLTLVTSVVFGIFLTVAVVLNLIANSVDKAHGGSSASTVGLTAADRSSLPKPQLPPPGLQNPTPTPTPTSTVPPSTMSPTTVPSSVDSAVPPMSAPAMTTPSSTAAPSPTPMNSTTPVPSAIPTTLP